MKTIQLLLAFMLAIVGVTPAWSQLTPVQEQALSSKDYAINGGFESGLANWKTYADSGAVPTDCVGGSPTVTLAASKIGPIAPKTSGVITKPASDVQGQGHALSFSLDKAARTKPITITGSYEISSGTYSGGSSSTDSDLVLYVYDVDGAQIIQPTGYKLNGGVIDNTYDIIATFQAPHYTTNSRSFRMCLHHATTSASAFSVRVDSFKIQVPSKSQGAAVGPRTVYTPATAQQGLGNITITDSDEIAWTRFGKYMFLEVKFQVGTAAALQARFDLPAGHTIDLTEVPNTRSANGKWIRNRTTASTTKQGVVLMSGGATYVQFGLDDYTGAVNPFTPLNGDALFGSGDHVSFSAWIPIAGWGSSQTLSDQTDTRVIAANYTRNTTLSVAHATDTVLPFTTLVKDTSGSYNTSTGLYTCSVQGLYQVNAKVHWASNGAGDREIKLYKNGSFYRSMAYFLAPPVGGDFGHNGMVQVECNAGDTLGIYVRQTSGGALNVGSSGSNYNHFDIQRISGPSQIVPSEVVTASYYMSANATVSAGAQINFDSKEEDSHSAVSVGASWKFAAPRPGTYNIEVSGGLSAAGTGYIQIYKNNALYKWIGYFTGSTVHTGTTLIKLNAGDYIDIRPSASLPAIGGTLSTNGIQKISIRSVSL